MGREEVVVTIRMLEKTGLGGSLLMLTLHSYSSRIEEAVPDMDNTKIQSQNRVL